MADDMGEKSELPSQHKLDEARERGQVAKSTDLAAAVDLIGGALILVALGSGIARAGIEAMRRGLSDFGNTLTPEQLGGAVRELLMPPAIAFVPVLVLILVIVVLAHVMQVGIVWTTQPLMPKLERLSPIKGLGNLFGQRNLVRSLLSILKLIIVCWVGISYMTSAMDQVASLPVLDAKMGFATIATLCIKLLAWLLTLLLCLGVADYLYQRWQHTEDLRMTKQEVQDERRSMEGDPLVKGRRMRMMRQIAMQQIGQNVPKANVIVTNPTHFSVAIEYDDATMVAPRVVAKGVDFMAMRIRQVGAVHQIPIVERPPLARALYYQVEVGQEIPSDLYQAVAELLAYVYRLEKQVA